MHHKYNLVVWHKQMLKNLVKSLKVNQEVKNTIQTHRWAPALMQEWDNKPSECQANSVFQVILTVFLRDDLLAFSSFICIFVAFVGDLV